MGHRSSSVCRILAATSLVFSLAACDGAAPTESFSESPVFLSTPVVAKPADGVVNSIGINVHMAYFQSPYGTAFSTVVKPRLSALGVRHLRDVGTVVSNDGWMTTVYGRMKELANAGMRFNLVMRPGESGSYTNVDHYTRLMTYAGTFVENFEGLNEHDLSGRANWASEVRSFQQALWTRVKGDPRTTNMPVFGPSLGRPGNAPLVGDISASLNYSAIHPYPGSGTPSSMLSYFRLNTQPMSKSRAFVATESGYHTATSYTGPHPPVTEQAMARYVPRLYLEYYDAGIPRTYLYELIDQGTSNIEREQRFGLLRNDGSEKPAYRALANMIAILKDPGASFPAGSLGYSVAGDTIGVRRMLLQKRDGRFYLAMWNEGSSYDVTAHSDLPNTVRNVTLRFDAPMAKVQQYWVNTGTAPTATATAVTSITLGVKDQVLLVEITK